MFRREEIPSLYTEDFKTLHHDIGLVRRTNGLWDLWFGQDELSKRYENAKYLTIKEGDIVSATEIHSLQVAIIIACLTSWNYLNRTGNPIYTKFGNESYSLLKKNKGTNTQYKIKQYFIDCLNRMRRVYSVEYLEVYETDNPYIYKVLFKVISITNTIVDGEFYLNTDATKNISILEVNYNQPYTSVSNPLNVECVLKNEYGSVLEGEIIYIYIKNDNDSKFRFYGITEPTNTNGYTYVTIPPKGLNFNTQIMFIFKGNSQYNPSASKVIQIQSVAYYIKSRFTYKSIENDYGESVDVVDKQILYVEDSDGRSLEKFRLGELLSDYVNLENIVLSDYIPIEDIEANYWSNNYKLEWEEIEDEEDIYEKNNKLFLIPTERAISGTNKVYYQSYVWNRDGTGLNKLTSLVQLNTDKPYEVHFLIDDGENGLFEIDFDDGNLYYHAELLDNEEIFY